MLGEVLHQDFADCSALAEALSGQDATVHCLGTIYRGVEFARVLRLSSPEATFSFLSGGGADPTGRSRIPYARYKGEAENALIAAGFPSSYIFRPGYIYPVEPRKEPNFSYRFMRAICPVFRALLANQVIRADDLARAMVDVVVRRTGEHESSVFENRDIRRWSSRFVGPSSRDTANSVSNWMPCHQVEKVEIQNIIETVSKWPTLSPG